MNKLCGYCRNSCKQADSATVLECRKYKPAPVQMVLKFKYAKNKVSGTSKK